MKLTFTQAKSSDAKIVGALVVQLTEEICERTAAKHFDINLEGTVRRCEELLFSGYYAAIIAWSKNTPIAVSTITETYALYAGGAIGIIQEFYVLPEFRSSGIGSLLIEEVRNYGIKHNWSCLELCTPPLPEFDRALNFYQDNGLVPVGGRKMRQELKTPCRLGL